MANIHGLRHLEKRSAPKRRRFWHAMVRRPRPLAILGLALVAGALLAGLFATGELRSSTGRASVVSRALGPNDPGFTLDRRWDALTRVSISAGGLHVRHAGTSVKLTATGSGSSGWTHHRYGVDRPTPFGREAIVVAAPRTEEYLTVDRHVGARTWKWQLATGLSKPRLEDDGSISFFRAGRQAGIRVLPPVVFAADGRDITPPGAHWSLAHSGGLTTLALRLDDASFPTPYVIDPIAIVGSPGGTGQTKTGSPLAITMPTGVASGNLLVASVSLRDATATVTPPAGWTLLTSIPTSGAHLQAVHLHAGRFRRRARLVQLELGRRLRSDRLVGCHSRLLRDLVGRGQQHRYLDHRHRQCDHDRVHRSRERCLRPGHDPRVLRHGGQLEPLRRRRA